MTNLQGYNTEPSGTQTVLDKIYIGFVKDVRDAERMGRIRVWVPNISPKEPDDSTGWFTVNYVSPFAGSTPETQTRIDNGQDQGRVFEDTQKSYGFWFVPPDLDNEVLVAFINGDPAKGVWFGCLFKNKMNHMIPGIASSTSFGDDENVTQPTSEYNKRDREVNVNNPIRPGFSPLSYGLNIQGLFGDFSRGQSSSTAQRETPSRVQGFVTPRGNHCVFDDGYKEDELGDNLFDRQTNPANQFERNKRNTDRRQDEYIRFRTRSGAQIMISETEGFVYLISRDGKTWLELSNDGEVDVYGLGDISVRSNQNVNIRSDKDVNIEAGRNLNMKASAQFNKTGDVDDGTGDGGNIHLESVGSTTFVATQEINAHSRGNLNLLSSSEARLTSADNLNFRSSGGNIIQTGVNIHLNGPGAVPADNQSRLATQKREDKDALSARTGTWPINRRETIVTRIPSHEPFSGHNSKTTGTNGFVEQLGEGELLSTSEQFSIDNASAQPNKKPQIVETPQGRKTQISTTKSGDAVYRTEDTTRNFEPAKNRTLSEEGVDLIARFEGYEQDVYEDSAGFETIGFGHKLTEEEKRTGVIDINGQKVNIDEGISRNLAEELLKQDARAAERAVQKYTNNEVTQSQFDALVSFTYNVGSGAFRSSTLLQKVNQGQYEDVPGEFARWNKAGGQVLAGLVNRRSEEAELFVSA